MKKLLITVPAFLFLFFISQINAQSKNARSDKARKNLEACNIVNKAIMTGDFSTLDNVLAENAVDHAGMQGDLVGREAIKTELTKFHTMAPDMKVDVIRELADDEYAFQWVKFTGTTVSGDMGMPAGTKFDMNAIEVVRFKDGKAQEHWEFMQPADVMKMVQSNNMNNKPDSSMQK
jgi:predicted SnoaL-like aldol condensation-catalyzing enzyme